MTGNNSTIGAPSIVVRLLGVLASVLSVCVPAHAAPVASCEAAAIGVQVLGSGGPVADDARASAGYLVWVDGKARVLIDAGGGVFQRFGASGAKIESLQHIGITHFHADHSADLTAIVKSGYFSKRRDPLTISGPGQGGYFPSLEQFLQHEFDESAGAYRYLHGALDGSGGLFRLVPQDVDQKMHEATTVSQQGGLLVQAVGVDHGPVPAIGYVITVNGTKIAFSGDMNGSREDFWRLAEDAELLFMDHAIPQRADRVARNLHATPETIGRRAHNAGVRHLVLSHLMKRSLDEIEESLQIIRRHYSGTVDVAEDLACYIP